MMARNALMDFLQAASNEAAGAVSGPVDLLSWGLRKAGVPVPKNALLSSEWMAQQGLTRPVQPGAAQVAGATAGLLSPVGVAAKAPQIAAGLLQAERAIAPKVADMAEGYMSRAGMMQPAIVWHGSPHKFDKFDSSKIGTGEGAQAYGHGLYLAESEKVAQGYKDKLAPSNLNWGNFVQPDEKSAASRVLRLFGEDGSRYRTTTGRNLEDVIARFGGKRNKTLEQTHKMDAVWQFKDKSLIADGGGGWDIAAPIGEGHLYKVDLPDEKIARMLDWDRPLSQQTPEVQSAVRKAWDGWQLRGDFDSRTGAQVLSDITAIQGARGENVLRQAGIPGIRYLDGGSRGAGSGTSNFVVFPGEENALRILERNGKPVR